MISDPDFSASTMGFDVTVVGIQDRKLPGERHIPPVARRKKPNEQTYYRNVICALPTGHLLFQWVGIFVALLGLQRKI